MTSFFSRYNRQIIMPVIVIVLFSGIAYWPVSAQPVSRDPATKQVEMTDKTDKTDKTEKTEPDQSTSESAAYLAEAGKFRIGKEPTFWILVVLFNFALAVAIERLWVYRKNRGDNTRLVQVLTEKLSDSNNNVEELSRMVSTGFGMEGRVAAVTLKGWNFGLEAMKEYAGSSMLAERRNLERRLVVLSTLGNNTPFIGLLGTVLGIMKAFRDLAYMGDAGPAVVMKGISEALVATAMGLGVAIPCVIAFNALSRIVKSKLSSAEEISTLLRAIRLSVLKS